MGDRKTILIADDDEMNRSLLADMLRDAYDIVEAADGGEVIEILEKSAGQISLLLLDMVLPVIDGYGVLKRMGQTGCLDFIPVIVLAPASGPDQVERAYALGATDFILRPFDTLIVRRRVENTLMLYTKQEKLVRSMADAYTESERRNRTIISILSHVVEFRNGESQNHLSRVRSLTEELLQQLSRSSEMYTMSQSKINLIGATSALHDIGKVLINEDILYKRGELTEEETRTIRSHTIVGAEMLAKLPIEQEEEVVRTAYEICRWHHERYDGNGYPDGLKGEEIPLAAQVVGLADAYDSLTNSRKNGKVSSAEAVEKLLRGECGAFNPILLECVRELSDQLESQQKVLPLQAIRQESAYRELLQQQKLQPSQRTLQLMEQARIRMDTYAEMTNEIQFEYTYEPSRLTFSSWGAKTLGMEEVIEHPLHNQKLMELAGSDGMRLIRRAAADTNPMRPLCRVDCLLHYYGIARWYRIILRKIWSDDKRENCIGFIGKAVDINDSHNLLQTMEKRATHDPLTGLYNVYGVRAAVQERIHKYPTHIFTMVMFDLDHFKSANDTYGHLFGNQVLQYVADRLQQSTRSQDILARVGGDEFLLFLDGGEEIEPIIQRLFRALNGYYESFRISLSMGLSQTSVVGYDYETLLHAADQALYAVKRNGRGEYRFYDSSLKDMLSVMSPIDSDSDLDSDQPL